MLGAAIIVFRESFEAALIIGIVAAATRSLPWRRRAVTAGIALGVAGAVVVAAAAGRLAGLFDGMGQEIFNASILGIAVVMLAWHNMWMAVHGAELAADARRVGREVSEGLRGASAIVLVIAVAVLREGAETVLFLYGVLSASGSTVGGVAAGGAMGLAMGVVVGVVIYAGIVRVPVRWFFTVTSGLILLLAASMASQMARFLVQGDVLPALADPLWDSSAWLAVDSPLGALLHALAGYEATPSGIQLVFYGGTFVLVFAGMRLVRRRAVPAPRPSAA
jgi:high-affinity iron transporter